MVVVFVTVELHGRQKLLPVDSLVLTEHGGQVLVAAHGQQLHKHAVLSLEPPLTTL